MDLRFVVVVIVIVVAMVGACAGEPVGRKCDIGGPAAATELVVSSDSLDCVSRTCLRLPLGGDTGMCTAACVADADCEAVPESACRTGFTCGIPPGATVGAFCCQKLCVCKDTLDLDATGHLGTPAACDPSNPDRTCEP